MTKPRPIELSVPVAMTDLFAMILLVYISSNPSFLDSQRLVELSKGGGTADKTLPAEQQISLLSTGELTLNGQPLLADQLVTELQATDGLVRLAIEKDDNGRGAVEQLIELQLALSRSGQMHRVQIVHLPKPGRK